VHIPPSHLRPIQSPAPRHLSLRRLHRLILVPTAISRRPILHFQTHESPRCVDSRSSFPTNSMPLCRKERRPCSVRRRVEYPGWHYRCARTDEGGQTIQ
jgi:hypothetical protein